MKVASKIERIELHNDRQQPLIDINKYNRSPYLTKSEKEEIRILVNRFDSGGKSWSKKSYKILSRLLNPLYDVLEVIGAKGRTKRDSVNVILKQMSFRQKSYWGWSQSDWCEVIGIKAEDFYQICTHTGSRQPVICLAYYLGNFNSFYVLHSLYYTKLARRIFGDNAIDDSVKIISRELQNWGYGRTKARNYLANTLSQIFLVNHSGNLNDITTEKLENIRSQVPTDYIQDNVFMVSKALKTLGIIDKALKPLIKKGEKFGQRDALNNVSPQWANWCKRWFETSTLALGTRKLHYYNLLKAGRWLALKHPEIDSPTKWSRELGIEFVGVINNLKISELAENIQKRTKGNPLAPRSKAHILSSLRAFFRDCQEWEWIPRKFSPERTLATPRSIMGLISPNPRVIADDIWAKLLWAGLNLTEEDIPRSIYNQNHNRGFWYPLEMVQAIVIVWLFAGIRNNEISRLRVGCVRWQKNDVIIPGTSDMVSKDAICYLEIPVNKTSPSYTKPVDKVLGEAVESWEKLRPQQPSLIDKKDGSLADFLFLYRGRKIGEDYINIRIIPILCKKAGIPTKDAKGNITSHRARSTIATQLSTSKNPMTLLELKDWLGHSSVSSTINYAKVTPTKLAKSYQDAEYFKRNLRTVEVLIDQDAISSGAATNGEPWKYYDLGHGLCTYDFFSQCKHRMACAGCSFYVPKGSSKAQIIEAKDNLERMLQEIPLTEDEEFAVTEGIEALAKLKEKLADVPAPDGKTPKQLEEEKENA